MNTHSKPVTDQALKRAETLRSLSLEAVSQNIEPPKQPIRRIALSALVFALISGTVAGIAVYPRDLIDRIGGMALALFDSTGRTDKDVSVSDDRYQQRHAEQRPGQHSVPAIGEITGSGFVVAPRMTMVFSKYEGRITDIAVDAGDAVAAGQVLAKLDDAAARFVFERAKAAKSAAELQLAAQMIDLSQAHASLARIKTLSTREAASRQAVEEAQTAFDQAANAVAQARQSVEATDLSIRIAEERLDELKVRAPFAGIVTRLDAHVGDTVLARIDSVREGQSLLTITDTSSMVIDADVAETSLATLKPGLRGEAVLDGFPDRPFRIAVLRLAPVVSAEKGTIALRLSLDHPPEGIRPNMAARIRIPLDNTGDANQ